MSFKLKLAAYFVLLSLLPLAAAFAGFSAVVERSETRLADARLEAGLRAAIAAYQQELAGAAREARAVASGRLFQRALADRDRRELQRLLADSPRLRVETGDGFRVGAVPPLAAERQVAVVGPEGIDAELGVVIASVPLDERLAGRLRVRSGLPDGDRVVILRTGRIAAGPRTLGGSASIPYGRPTGVRIGGTDYRALAAGAAGGASAATLAVLTPQSRIDAANRSARLRLLGALAASLLLVAIVAYLEGRSIVRTLGRLVDAAHRFAGGRLDERVDVRGKDEFALLGHAFNDMAEQLAARLEDLDAERRRLREATLRFGEALSATHDVPQLLRAIVETAVESTGATGGLILGRKGEIVRAGDPDQDEQQFELPLVAGRESFGRLVLFGPRFSVQDLETAALLVGHAVVALENARLHAIVEHQALVDGLTGLANRRAAEERLAAEVARAHRFGTTLALVFCDLDSFKDVNDVHGHPTGDDVLREFAAVLRETVREIDLAARWGGEEFALVLPGTDAAGAVQLAERVREALGRRVILSAGGTPVRVTASFGVATAPPTQSKDDLVSAADVALYQAKRAGKDRVETAVEPAPRP